MLLRIKILISKLLVNNITGFLLFLFYKGTITFHGLKININYKIIRKKIAAALFFKTYESSEIRFIEKYLNNYSGTIIELGSSIGVMSSFISKNNPNSKILAFEADSRFIPIIQNNHKINNITNVSAFNEIIGVNGYEFFIGEDNTKGKIQKSNQNNSKNVNLNDILDRYKIDDDFVLISDIEGAEYFVLLNSDESVFKNCSMIIIELHDIEIDGNLITPETMIAKMKAFGFTIVDQYAGNIVAKK
ncbi:FkbM family methyltransferase [Flavobacterium urocaniciphilum]|uniref:Methyltransferase, FkbM family n=1 Tax=Flavobacterium urocaniciphilum TaxID=1299341 RepID=A0A1H8YRU1_9FLAO|nr:FkbM family methyltransferase [Flavobacterium urocaniciphilum]SEP54762.1 methyltransferase, FkbM family [Flavobacterium urocaniciphilum]